MIYNKYIYNPREISDTISEKEKEKPAYLVGNAEYSIGHLVTNKDDIRLAYKYYHGELDEERFKYLEDMYGVSKACDLVFVPLVRKHIEALKGQFLSYPIENFGITCTDRLTLDSIQEEKKKRLLGDVLTAMDLSIEQAVKTAKESETRFMESRNAFKSDTIEEIAEYYDSTWLSKWEEAAQYLLTHITASNEVDFLNKMATMLEDLLVTGSCYYRVKDENEGEEPSLLNVNPLDIFYNKNTNDPYIKQCTRVVERFWRTPEELVNEYSDELTEEEIEMLYSTAAPMGSRQMGDDLHLLNNLTGLERNNFSQNYSYSQSGIVECFRVEFIANNVIEYEDYDDMEEDSNGITKPKKKKRYRSDRYSVTKLGGRIYVRMGKDKVKRSQSAPYKCQLSYNGVSYTDKNGKPYSLVLKTADLQDKYNIYLFHRDNVIAKAGVKGVIIDASFLPNHMGNTPEERMMNFMQTLRQGLGILNTAQEGASEMNTVIRDFDQSLDMRTVQAYNLALETIEDTLSSITGVPRQMLADIEQRDAVGNVQASMRQSMIINKPIFNLIDTMMKHSLTDLIDACKIGYKKGKMGASLLGHFKSKIFTLEPEFFTFTDHSVHVTDSTKHLKNKEEIKMLAMELVKAQRVGVDTILDLITSNSLTEIKGKVKRDVKKSDQTLQQLQQQMQQIEELKQQLDAAMKKAEQADEVKIKESNARIKEMEAQSNYNAGKLKIEMKKLENQEKMIKVEAIELLDTTNKRDDEPRNIGII